MADMLDDPATMTPSQRRREIIDLLDAVQPDGVEGSVCPAACTELDSTLTRPFPCPRQQIIQKRGREGRRGLIGVGRETTDVLVFVDRLVELADRFDLLVIRSHHFADSGFGTFRSDELGNSRCPNVRVIVPRVTWKILVSVRRTSPTDHWSSRGIGPFALIDCSKSWWLLSSRRPILLGDHS
jgi:hypothetical protein